MPSGGPSLEAEGQAGQADDRLEVGGGGGSQSRGELVSTADFSLIEGGISRGAFDAGFSRDDLPLPLRSGPGPPPQGADQAPASTSPDSTAQTARDKQPRKDQGHDQHQRAPR